MSEEPTVHSYRYPHCCEDDPGIMFVLWPTSAGASAVHTCLGLPSIANLIPALQQGRRTATEGSVTTNIMFMLPGANPEQSVDNLYRWFDTIMTGMGYSSSLVMTACGQRIPGVFHHLSKEEFVAFRGHLHHLTRTWNTECVTRNLSAWKQMEGHVERGHFWQHQ